jgi:hypothetical protein
MLFFSCLPSLLSLVGKGEVEVTSESRARVPRTTQRKQVKSGLGLEGEVGKVGCLRKHVKKLALDRCLRKSLVFTVAGQLEEETA